MNGLKGKLCTGTTRSSSFSGLGSGANVVLAVGSTECDLFWILGFPARLIGGGTSGGCDLECTSRSKVVLFRGSTAFASVVVDCKNGACFASIAGVAARLGILKVFAAVLGVVAGLEAAFSSDACVKFLEGVGECNGVPLLGGDFGDCTMTLGGDLVCDLGGEAKAIIQVDSRVVSCPGLQQRHIHNSSARRYGHVCCRGHDERG